jgi:arylformamidase
VKAGRSGRTLVWLPRQCTTSQRFHVADHPETKGQSQRLVKALQEAGVSAKAYPAEGKNHTTINADLGLPDDKPTQALFEFLGDVLKK